MGGIPVVVSPSGRGLPVRAVDRRAPKMTVAENGRGLTIVLTDRGAPFVVDGLAPAPDLTAYYGVGPGKIAIHYDTDHVTQAGAPLFLNDAAATARGMMVSSVAPDHLTYMTDSSGIWSYSMPIPPPGSIIEFDITCDGTTYFRLDLDDSLAAPDVIELVPGGVPPGTQHVRVSIPDYTNQTRIGFKNAALSRSVQITNWRVTRPVTALQNRGGAGAVFDATVIGAPIPVVGNALSMTASGGVPTLANAASLDQVRFMWVCSTEGLANGTRLFGGPFDEIRIGAWSDGPPPQGSLQIWSNRTGSGVNFTLTPKWTVPTTGLHLLELDTDLAAGVARFYVDGLEISTATDITHSALEVNRIGQGAGGAGLFVGLMGDPLGVTLGAGADEAIAVARAYLAARHGITLT